MILDVVLFFDSTVRVEIRILSFTKSRAHLVGAFVSEALLSWIILELGGGVITCPLWWDNFEDSPVVLSCTPSRMIRMCRSHYVIGVPCYTLFVTDTVIGLKIYQRTFISQVAFHVHTTASWMVLTRFRVHELSSITWLKSHQVAVWFIVPSGQLMHQKCLTTILMLFLDDDTSVVSPEVIRHLDVAQLLLSFFALKIQPWQHTVSWCLAEFQSGNICILYDPSVGESLCHQPTIVLCRLAISSWRLLWTEFDRVIIRASHTFKAWNGLLSHGLSHAWRGEAIRKHLFRL